MKIRPPAIYQMLGLNVQGDIGPYTTYRSKRGKMVIFLRAPPRVPPSDWQINIRNRWTVIAAAWASLPAAVRAAWLRTARRAHLRMSGYNLYLLLNCNPDPAALATICRLAGTDQGDLA